MAKRKGNRAKTKARNRRVAGKPGKKFNIAILFILAILFSIILTEITYFLYNIEYIKIFDAKLEVSNAIGFALGKQEVDFGLVNAGGSARRYIDVENQGGKEITVQIFMTGNLEKFVSYENYVTIKPNETKNIQFEAFVPEGTAQEKYTGKIFLIFKKT